MFLRPLRSRAQHPAKDERTVHRFNILAHSPQHRRSRAAGVDFLLHDVPPGATVAGVPARIVGWSSGSVPALEMDQSLPDYEI